MSILLKDKCKGVNLLTNDVLNLETYRKTKYALSEGCLLFSLPGEDALSVSGEQDSYLKYVLDPFCCYLNFFRTFLSDIFHLSQSYGSLPEGRLLKSLAGDGTHVINLGRMKGLIQYIKNKIIESKYGLFTPKISRS